MKTRLTLSNSIVQNLKNSIKAILIVLKYQNGGTEDLSANGLNVAKYTDDDSYICLHIKSSLSASDILCIK